MYLYSLTLQRATAITVSCHGNFSGQKQQEIAVAKGKNLEILKPDSNTGKVHTIYATDVFGVIRSLMSFRLTGGSKDYIIVGSDSGRICILEFNPVKNVLEKVHMETFGKSGCRRIVPGQYLAVDPKGRAVMIGAIEKQKLVYILNRDSNARLTISSPLEAHKSNTLVYHMVGVDVGFENPMFACIELDYEEADNDPSGDSAKKLHQSLTFYELDLGLNHVVRKYSEDLEEPSNFLIAVPGGSDGPSGVLVCSENFITYKNFGDQPDIRCPIPRRRNDLDDSERGMLFVCSTQHKTKSMFFFLAQSEQGDIFKITMACDDDMVTEIKLKYFDTLPVAQTMHVLKSGFLFVASEFGNHALYQIAHLGDNQDEPEFTSSIPLDDGDTFFFVPRELKNLVLVDEIDSLSPIMHAQVADLTGEDTPQLYAACGRGAKSSLRVLRHGLEVTEMAVSELPGNPNAVWTVKRRFDDEFDAYIVVSFINATLVLSIGETVEEITDSGFLGTTPTLACHQIGDDALVQIYPEGIRHIRADKRVNEWRTPGKKQIIKSTVNRRQVVIALTGGELVYFEMDSAGHLNEYTERKEMNEEVHSMALGPVPPGEQRTRFLAVGLPDTVRILSLDPKSVLDSLNMQFVPSPPESLAILDVTGHENTQAETLYLNIGLQNGLLLRSVLDSAAGALADTRTRFLGSRSVKLFTVKMQGADAILAMSTRCWLSYVFQNRFHLTPLSYESLEFASGFCSEQCPEGIVAIAGNTLRILALEKLGAVFNQVSAPLEFTPRRFVVEPESNKLIVLETEHNAYTEVVKEKRKQQVAEEMIEAAGEEEQEMAAEMAAAFLSEDLPEGVFGAPRAGLRYWASQIRIMNPSDLSTVFKLCLEQNEAAVSCALVNFDGPTTFLLVGVTKELQLNPRVMKNSYVHTYKVLENCSRLELHHTTIMDDVPQAMCAFFNKVLIGVGRSLRIYELGKKKLLRKCENKHLPNLIVTINVLGNRIVVGDLQESFFFVRYRVRENQLIIFADDFTPRWTTAACMIDYRTVAGADKFGNVYFMRLPNDISDEVDEDPTGVRSLWDRGWLGGSAQKVEVINCTHIGEVVVSIQKAALIPGGPEAVVYTTIAGGVGALMPFSSKEDHEFFQHLEMYMRTEHPPICGRDHLSYKSYYFPVKNIIDGDLCEQFNSLDAPKQRQIAEDLDRQPHEVAKKLEDIRTRFAF